MDGNRVGRRKDTAYRKTFVLRQQTPMLHFQYQDDGVIIRASEFKPKLDKFLMKKLDGDSKESKEKKSGWFLEETGKTEPSSFNYKVRIIATGTPERIDDKHKINSMYFGQTGKGGIGTIFYQGNIYVEIQCFIEDLLDYISESMAEFILVTNFGTRQSKGFGSFALFDGKKLVPENPIELLKKEKYEFIYGEINQNNKIKALNVANGIYAVMKGGINRGSGDRYIKGYIQRQYLDDCKCSNARSEKAFIKSEVLSRQKKTNGKQEGQRNDYQYVRAILGVASQFKFQEGIVKTKSDQIERFASAIQISIWGNYIFLIAKEQEYINYILGEKFEFSYKGIQNYVKKEIRTPSEFDSKKFLSGFVKYYNNNREKLKKLPFKDAGYVELKTGRREGETRK